MHRHAAPVISYEQIADPRKQVRFQIPTKLVLPKS